MNLFILGSFALRVAASVGVFVVSTVETDFISSASITWMNVSGNQVCASHRFINLYICVLELLRVLCIWIRNVSINSLLPPENEPVITFVSTK